MPKPSHPNPSSTFEREYWKKLYGDGLDVDGSFNAKEHANYIHSLFGLVGVEVETLADFGFGQAKLLQAVVQKTKPKSLFAFDISETMVQKLNQARWLKLVPNHKIVLGNLADLSRHLPPDSFFSLGILNSVLQYIPPQEIPALLTTLAKHCRYLYLTVPTKKDYALMKEEFQFHDPYAYQHSAQTYHKWFSRDFEIVSYNLLQSKWFTEPAFREDVFRF